MSKLRRVAVMIDLTWPLPHHHHVFSGIHRYAAEHGNWDCTIDPHVDRLFGGKQRSVLPDGVIGRATPLLAKAAHKARVPVVNIWMNSPAKSLPSVIPDAAESGRMAARHLMERAFRRYAYLGVSRIGSSRLQCEGFRKTLSKGGFDCAECWVSQYQSRDRVNWQRFQQQLDDWIDSWSPPIAVFTHTDLLARYVAEACHKRQLKVPSDVALVGTQNEPLICLNPEPTLSSINLGFDQIGYRAAQLLDSLLDGDTPPKKPIRLAPVELVARQSSNAFAADDPLVMAALTYISEHAYTTISVDDVAAAVSTTRRTLARRFQRYLGQSIHQTITHLRMDRVKRDLLETDDTLKTISRRCGLRDEIHLCRVFLREEGISPGEFRSKRRTMPINHFGRKRGTGKKQVAKSKTKSAKH